VSAAELVDDGMMDFVPDFIWDFVPIPDVPCRISVGK
jgi:hypothetical protein